MDGLKLRKDDNFVDITEKLYNEKWAIINNLEEKQ
jgi:hypothetical protein